MPPTQPTFINLLLSAVLTNGVVDFESDTWLYDPFRQCCVHTMCASLQHLALAVEHTARMRTLARLVVAIHLVRGAVVSTAQHLLMADWTPSILQRFSEEEATSKSRCSSQAR